MRHFEYFQTMRCASLDNSDNFDKNRFKKFTNLSKILTINANNIIDISLIWKYSKEFQEKSSIGIQMGSIRSSHGQSDKN